MQSESGTRTDGSGTAAASPRYWAFYWPLALTGLVSLLAQQIQNAALARYPDAAHELATFALAAGTYQMFDAVLVFVPQMVNVLARSRRSARLCLRFTLAVCAAMTVPVVLLALPPIGTPVLGSLFHIGGTQLRQVMLYLALLSPNIVMVGLRHYYTGLIVQEKRTGIITVLNVSFLAVIAVMLILGRALGLGAVLTLALAQIVASTGQLLLLRRIARAVCDPDRHGSPEHLTVRQIADFFWPVALTSLMFSLSRPILYSFLGRLPDPAPVIAAMRVGFDFGLIFHNLLNQFRHLFATFGKDDLPGLRRFMAKVTCGSVTAMLLVVLTPLSQVVLRDVIGVTGNVLAMSRQVLLVMCLLPILVAFRNYFHGLAMIDRKTGPMGAGAVVRNIATYAASAALLALGWLNPMTATAVLVVGFLGEALVVIFWHPAVQRGRAALAWIPWLLGGDQEDD